MNARMRWIADRVRRWFGVRPGSATTRRRPRAWERPNWDRLEPREVLSTVGATPLAALPGRIATAGTPAQVHFNLQPGQTKPDGSSSFYLGLRATPTAASSADPKIVKVANQAGDLQYPITGDQNGVYISKVIAPEPGPTPYAVDLIGLDDSVGDFVLNAYLPGDVDGSGTVDRDDLNPIRAAYGSSTGQRNYDPAADVNGDGRVGGLDRQLALWNLGAHAPTITPMAPARPAPAATPAVSATPTPVQAPITTTITPVVVATQPVVVATQPVAVTPTAIPVVPVQPAPVVPTVVYSQPIQAASAPSFTPHHPTDSGATDYQPFAAPQGYTYLQPTGAPQGYAYVQPTAAPEGYAYAQPTGAPQGYAYAQPTAAPQGYAYVQPTGAPQGYAYVQPTGDPQVYAYVQPTGAPQGYAYVPQGGTTTAPQGASGPVYVYGQPVVQAPTALNTFPR